jgi:hypothetical protein
MRKSSSIVLILSVVCIACPCVPQADRPDRSGSEALYKRHDWFALEKRITSGTISDPLILGATATALGDDEKARKYLEPLLTGKDAGEAHTWLSYIDMRKGRYREAAEHIEAANGNEHDPLAATFRELPDQMITSRSPATIRYRILQRKLFVPASLNHQSVEFICDSDANLSFVSEAAAKRLGLSVRHSSATTAGALGVPSQLDMTTADVVIGKTVLSNVAFMVFRDSASVFAGRVSHVMPATLDASSFLG